MQLRQPRIATLWAIGLALAVASSAQAPADYPALIQKGTAQLQAGSAALALAAGDDAVRTDPERWEGYALAGGALMNLKRYEEAVDKLSEAINHAPEAKQEALRSLRRQCLLAESAVPAAPEAAKSAPEATATQAEIVLWKSIENGSDLTAFQAYLTRYPNGAFAVLAALRIKQIEERNAHRQASDEAAQQAAALANSGLTGRHAIQRRGKTGVLLATGNAVKVKGRGLVDSYSFISLDTFQGQAAIYFPTSFFCRGALVVGQVSWCSYGVIFITGKGLAFQKTKGQIEFSFPRLEAVIKSEGGREGDTFSIYDKDGKRYRFGDQKFDSPSIKFLQAAIATFPVVYAQLQQLVKSMPVNDGQ